MNGLRLDQGLKIPTHQEEGTDLKAMRCKQMDLDASAFAEERNNNSSEKKIVGTIVVTKQRPIFLCYKVRLYTQVKREHVIHNA